MASPGCGRSWSSFLGRSGSGRAAGLDRLLEGGERFLDLVLRVGEQLRHRVAHHTGRWVVGQADLDAGRRAVVVEPDGTGVGDVAVGGRPRDLLAREVL